MFKIKKNKLACCDDEVEDEDVSLMLLVLELTTFWRVVAFNLCFCCRLSNSVDISGPVEFVTASEISGIWK